MLRPATPLSVMLGIAFVLLLIAVISTPILKPIPLGSFKGVSFGVFGFCKADGECSPIELGYDTAPLFTPEDSATFNLPTSTRNTLSGILIIHPVAAFVTLLMLVLAIVSHLRAPSHSARFLLLLFIIGIIDLMVCLLAFLIDVLLFVPHMAWGSYLVLASTVLVALSGVVSCAMRRTVVSRKARKKRIEENAEMSGENFYNRQAREKASSPAAAMSTTLGVASSTSPSRQPTVPVLGSGANGSSTVSEKMGSFSAFDSKTGDQNSDERVPLTARSPSDRSPNAMGGEFGDGFGGPGSRRGQRDQYGNPIDPYGDPRRGASGRGRRGPPPGGFRGRGGYGPGGRGGPYGGGYGPPGRGGYGPPRGGPYGGGMRGGRPPPAYQGGGRGGGGPYDRRPSPGNMYGPGPYGRQSPGPPGAYPPSNGPSSNYDVYGSDSSGMGYPRAESPPPLPGDGGIGQAVEMDAATGSPQGAPKGFGQFGAPQLRDSDVDVAGMVGLQQARFSGGGSTGNARHDTYMSDGSKYSADRPGTGGPGAGEEQYVPARQAWNANGGRSSPRIPTPRMGTPLSTGNSRTPPPGAVGAGGGNPNKGNYYEDVDGRFANGSSSELAGGPAGSLGPPSMGGASRSQAPSSNYDEGFGGPSPGVESSISQRPVNPRWDNSPPPPLPSGPAYPGPPPSGPVPRRPGPPGGVPPGMVPGGPL